MELDTNQLCPGGTGKKIKFCCKDLTRELDKIVRLMTGGQRRAALDAIDKTLAAKGDRACLYALKAETLREAGDAEGAKTAMSAYAEKFSDNPVALAEGVIAKLEAGELASAVDQLQTAVELSGDSLDAKVYAAFGFVARALLMDGNLPAARAHLLMQADLTRGQDREPLELLHQIDSSPNAPVLLKFGLDLAEGPEGVAWKAELDAALEKADRGEWRRALHMHQELAQKQPAVPLLLRNIAVLTTRLGDRDAAAKAWREYAAGGDISWDDRVEAEAVAQLLEPAQEEDQLEELKIVHPIRDLDQLMEKLLSDPRVVPYPGDLRELVDEEETPPRGAFTLLDRPAKLSEGVELTVDTVPNVLGEVVVFGRRTDREARLEFDTTRNERFEQSRQTLAEVSGDAVGPVDAEEVVGKISRVGATLSWQWRFPPETSEAQRRELLEQKRRTLLFEKWPDVPRAILDGKTPRQAAADEAYRVRVAAAVLLLDLAGQQAGWDVDFNALRDQLGLPPREAIDPATVDLTRLPLTRFALLQVEKLSDDELVVAYRRAAAFGNAPALEKLAREALQRESLEESKFDRAQAHHLLAQVTRETREALEHLHACQEMLIKRGESPAPILIEEFRLRLATGEGIEECDRIFQRLRTHHFKEPGVAQELYRTLVEFGLVTPDGRTPTMGTPPATAERAGEGEKPGGSKIWTPGGAPAAGEAKKSSLWTPEMD